MKKAITIGKKVTSKQYGNGVITKIITPSTGYIEIDFNGTLKKLLIKYSDIEIEGVEVKKQTAEEKEKIRQRKMAEKFYVSHNHDCFLDSNGNLDRKKLNDFNEQVKKDAFKTISF